MADVLLSPQVITDKALQIFHNNIVLAKQVNRDYDEQFGKKGAKAGQTIKIRRPVQFTPRTGSTLSLQDVVETSVDLTLQPLKGIDWDFDDTDLAMTIDSFSERYLKPAMARLASEIDYAIYSGIYKQVYNAVGTPGSVPATALTYLQAGQKLDEFAAPRDDNRQVLLNPAAQAATVDGLKGLFQSSDRISKQYERGMMGQALGFDFYMSQNVPVHTVGPLGGTPLVNGASQGSAGTNNAYVASLALVTNGWTASAANRVKAGDVFTVAGVFAVNPETKQSTGSLMQFVVSSDTSSDGSGNATITIAPCPISGGAYQNVTALPTTGNAITVLGAANTVSPVNIAFHKDAFTLVTADLELPNGTDMAARSVYDGISLRFVRDFDITNNKRICRFDVLYGFVAQRPEWAARIQG
jgi:hypothetical protein